MEIHIMKIPTLFTYEGAEQYVSKKTQNEITLHKFKNNFGETTKFKFDGLTLEPGSKCVVTYLKGSSFKTGERVDYCFPIEVCKAEDYKG